MNKYKKTTWNNQQYDENVHLDLLYVRQRVREQRIGADGKGSKGKGKKFHCRLAMWMVVAMKVFCVFRLLTKCD